MKINKYITILDYDKEMFNFEQIIKDKMEYGNRRRQKDSQVTKKNESYGKNKNTHIIIFILTVLNI